MCQGSARMSVCVTVLVEGLLVSGDICRSLRACSASGFTTLESVMASKCSTRTVLTSKLLCPHCHCDSRTEVLSQVPQPPTVTAQLI